MLQLWLKKTQNGCEIYNTDVSLNKISLQFVNCGALNWGVKTLLCWQLVEVNTIDSC